MGRAKTTAAPGAWARLVPGALAAAVVVATASLPTPARAEEPAGPGAAASAACAPSLSSYGGAGLFDLPLAASGCPWRLALGLSLSGFNQSGYLFTDDMQSQLGGGVQLAANLGSHLELALLLSAQQSRNRRPSQTIGEGSQSAAQPPQSLGGTLLSAKLHTDWGPLVHAAVRAILRVHSGPADIGPNFRSIDFGADLLGTVDIGRHTRRLPLRLHWLAGYLHDRSGQLIADQDCMAAGAVRCLSERLVATSALSVGQPRMRLGLGADFAILRHRRALWQALALYHLDVGVSEGDPVLRALLSEQAMGRPIDDRLAQWLTLGTLLHLPVPVNFELGVRIGLQSAGYAMGAKLPQVTGYGALSFHLDLAGGAPSGPPHDAQAEAQGTTATALREGQLRGSVRDAASGAPLPDAVVRLVGTRHNALLTDERGDFLSSGLPPGAVVVEASRGDHQTRRSVVLVRGGEVAAVELSLPPILRAAPARLLVEVRDDSGAPVPATGTLYRDSQSVELVPQPGAGAGALLARVPPGTWTLRIVGTGLLAREQLVVLPAGGELRTTLRLTRRPLVPRAQLGADEILLGEPLTFVPQTTALSTESGRLLDEVIDLLVRHPEIRQLRIEHSGDGSGGGLGDPGQALWEQQAIAVRDFLVQRGIAPERVVARIVSRPAAAPPGRRGPRISLKVTATGAP
ncbi:MAG: carboxypeptidase regulatory-like domain-containing protein [Polyangia bacterium]